MSNSTVIIEQFDNGISYKWESDNADPTHMVSLDVTRNQDLGKELWSDIVNFMDENSVSKVKLTITIEKEN